MSKEFFILKLMKRDGYDREGAESEINNAIELALYDHYQNVGTLILQAKNETDLEKKAKLETKIQMDFAKCCEDSLYDNLGLGPEYLLQFADIVMDFEQENPDYINSLLEDL
jgi:hypothetical protein